ncbi:hypothetical protein MMC07_006121 [Pseudocyphellaria aurata]|nr:hypothetical protein [Pseudocyphellaria aurata]
MDAPDLFHLTFGVEIEFIVSYDPDQYQNELLAGEGILWPNITGMSLSHKYGILVSRRIIQFLNEMEIPAQPQRHDMTDLSKWTVTTDFSIQPAEDREHWYACEVQTPALDYSVSDLEHVKTVVELLVSHFDLHVNHTCGLHVHVGNESRGFNLRTLKNFASLITVFEKQLNSLHSADRVQSMYAKPPGEVFHEDATPREKLWIIDQLDSVEKFISQFHPIGDRSLIDGIDRFMAFNFSHLEKGKPFQTIEFRQHQGTLDSTLITNWVKVACNLVHLSHANREGFRDLIETHMDNSKYTVMDLFVDLNMPDLAEFYRELNPSQP